LAANKFRSYQFNALAAAAKVKKIALDASTNIEDHIEQIFYVFHWRTLRRLFHFDAQKKVVKNVELIKFLLNDSDSCRFNSLVSSGLILSFNNTKIK